jgi:SAM-dependent methyltransferase
MENINTKEYWDRNYSGGFYQDHSVMDWGFSHECIKRVMPEKRCKVLELGCGLAHNAFYTASLGHYVIATDFSKIAIDENIKRYSRQDVVFDCLDIDKACETYKGNDVIMAFEILEHFDKPLLKLVNIKKSLKEGGIFIFTVPNEGGKYAVWPQHYTIFNYSKIGEMLFKAGFKEFAVFKTMFSHESILGVAR